MHEEEFAEKFSDVRRRIVVSDDSDTSAIEQLIYRELRGDPTEDAGILALRIKAQLSRSVRS